MVVGSNLERGVVAVDESGDTNTRTSATSESRVEGRRSSGGTTAS